MVPRFLLDHFASNDGKLHCFDKKRDREYVSSQSNAFVEKHIYTVKHRDGCDSYEMEEGLAKLEGGTSGVIDRIVKSARVGKRPNLPPSEKEILDEFAILQWRRVSARWKELEDGGGDEIMDEAIGQAERVFPDKDVRSELGAIGLDRILRNSWIQALGFEAPDWLATKGLVVLSSPHGHPQLIIGSNPVLLAGDDRRQPDGEVILPVAKDVAISLAGRAGQERLIVDEKAKAVPMINSHVFRQSDLVAASCRHHLRGLVEAYRKRRRKGRRRTQEAAAAAAAE